MVDGEANKGQALLSELESELTPEVAGAEAEPSHLEDFLGGRSAEAAVEEERALAAPAPSPGLRSAQLVSVAGRAVRVRFRGSKEAFEARVAPEVEPRLVDLAMRNRDSVLVEGAADELWVVGVLQVRIPERLELRAREILIEGEREVSLRAGRAGARLRKDGDVELVGSRISAASRGLFRIVGRILRLN
ncbi:MAG: hypothetical protein KC766_40970 [Myxococcales bacterium]|nr:hypothetical protein [Myxococcales bacterium]